MKTTKELQQAVVEYQKGKTESFNIIYEQSYKYLHTCVIHVVKNEDIAMDMLQETYLEISRSLWQLKDTENFLSWAAMIANRKCLAYLKKQRDVLLSADEDGENSDYFESIADNEAFIPETVLQDREKVRLIKEIIDNLSDIQRLCVIGFYYNEQKQDEIARELGIPVNTVKSHLNRAKAKIKEAVIDLDTKKGTRLYSLAPFMLLFLDLEAQACETAAMSPVLSQLCSNGNMVNAASETKRAFKKIAKTEKTWGMTSGTEKVIKTAALSMKAKVAIGAGIGLLSAVCIGSTIKGVYNVKELMEQTNVEADNGDDAQTGKDLEELLGLVKDVVSEENATKEDGRVSEELQEQSEENIAEDVTEESIKETQEDDESENIEVQEEIGDGNFEPLPISEQYKVYGKGNQGLIPVGNDQEKYGLVTYDNKIVVPLEYDYACYEVNDDGQSFFQNDNGSYVFDRNGKQLFHTKRSIQSIKDGVIFALDGSTFGVSYGYYTVDGKILYEYDHDPEYEMDDWATGYSEGYAFFGGSRLNAAKNIESMTDIVYGEQNRQAENNYNNGTGSESTGRSSYMGVPISALNQGFHLARPELIVSESYGFYYLENADASITYGFDFSSLFNRKGLSFTGTEAEWGFQSYFDDGCSYKNYGTLICPYTVIDGKKTCYLIDAVKLVENSEEYVNPGEFWSENDYWDYDRVVLTEEALLFEADAIDMSNEKYWLVKKDGQYAYIDHAGNVMGMYEDATEFSNGKALIIEGGTAYVIDESFTKIQELGKAISVTNYGEVFKIFMEEDFSTKMIELS